MANKQIEALLADSTKEHQLKVKLLEGQVKSLRDSMAKKISEAVAAATQEAKPSEAAASPSAGSEDKVAELETQLKLQKETETKLRTFLKKNKEKMAQLVCSFLLILDLDVTTLMRARM